MKKIFSICGTRPEVLRVITKLKNHTIVNTGQHYDYEMDEVFWEEMGFQPDYNLEARNFGEIYDKVSELLKKKKPDLVIIYGDTRSSLAGAIATKDNDIKLAHLEAGVRSYDMLMPEERNRIMIDAISDYLFVVNEKGRANLLEENIQGKIFVVGDLVYDRYVQKRKHQDYVLLTIHRKQNQNSGILKKIFDEYRNEDVLFPTHPVMKQYLERIDLKRYPKLEIVDPVSHERMLGFIKNAKLVVTDSGGVEREAFFMGVPLKVILRKNAWEDEINVFGDGNAEDKIIKIIDSIWKR